MLTLIPDNAKIATLNAAPSIQGKGNRKKLKTMPPKMPITIVLAKIIIFLFIKLFY